VEVSWTGADFRKAREASRSCDISVNQEVDDLVNLHNFLLDKRDILLHLLENPNLLEHESFTDLLWAVFHLYDELYQREFFDQLPVADVEHLSLDIRRVFTRLVPEWIGYMEHLQQEYPYLFSLAVRTNPFAPQSTVIFK
jgi:hypothetical protein